MLADDSRTKSLTKAAQKRSPTNFALEFEKLMVLRGETAGFFFVMPESFWQQFSSRKHIWTWTVKLPISILKRKHRDRCHETS